MIDDALKALGEMLSRPFLPILAKTVGLTIGLFVIIVLGAEWLFSVVTPELPGWAETLVQFLLGAALLVMFWFVAAPVTALVAGLFLDDIAEAVEKRDYPSDPPGRALPFLTGIAQALRFTTVVLAVNLVALILLLIPGVNLVAFVLANAFLLGREYFELCALRHVSRLEMRAIRVRHGGELFIAGLIIAGFLAIPVVNFLTPVFATCFSMHVFKRLSAQEPPQPAIRQAGPQF